MSEYIERGALLGKDGLFAQRGCTGECKHCGLWSKEGCKVIIEAPTADVVEVKHGRWINRRFGSADVICSECRTLETNRDSNYKSRFCPNCGAKMDGE